MANVTLIYKIENNKLSSNLKLFVGEDLTYTDIIFGQKTIRYNIEYVKTTALQKSLSIRD